MVPGDGGGQSLWIGLPLGARRATGGHGRKDRDIDKRQCYGILLDMSNGPATPTDALRTAMQKSGLSRNALARMSGVELSAVSRFMAGKRGLTLISLDQLAPVLGLALVRVKSATPSDSKGPQAARRATGGGSGASACTPLQRATNSPKKGHAL